ncbi:glycosyltransferase family 2 protein [Mixta intestinalis]|uniref:GalNAc(5)-diNAcBac-PP-undecaprenol beta-1,3-glucosyltransferase n=1 Tax=Mixta intestinalis TaxID=1615494 RepID=A0A6P1Q5G3_9GAMM|nr:glycosyltransferase family 2 protein [Mixta intestinalis]QHM73045.1 GalNAc(5)-diNAcBac-PP-undecaprenol beta-1,3-glucosyltransferase [Mixta intestinalis]
MNSPRLSIIVTAHNCEKWLQGTLNSIVASAGDALPRCEILIINDASEDNTQSIIESFAAVYPQIRHQQTQLRNIGKVRNYAVEQAHGDYILMVDGDDKLLSGAICTHLSILEETTPDIFLSRLIEDRGSKASRTVVWHNCLPEMLSHDEAIARFLVHRDIQAHFIGQYFLRSLLLDYPFPPFICYEDAWLFPLLLTKSRKTLYSKDGFYLYNKHASSLSTTVHPDKISCLLTATGHMDEVLPSHFNSLITCHWIDIANRYKEILKSTGEWEKVIRRINQQNLFSFLFSNKIRWSYKRKMLKVRRLK